MTHFIPAKSQSSSTFTCSTMPHCWSYYLASCLQSVNKWFRVCKIFLVIYLSQFLYINFILKIAIAKMCWFLFSNLWIQLFYIVYYFYLSFLLRKKSPETETVLRSCRIVCHLGSWEWRRVVNVVGLYLNEK